MKILTIRQPYAALLVTGRKTIEQRSWKTAYRGPLAIHSGLQDLDVPTKYRTDVSFLNDDLRARRGFILGVVDFVECREARRSDRDAMCADVGENQQAWLMSNPRLLSRPLPWKGSQGLRDLPQEVAEQVLERIR